MTFDLAQAEELAAVVDKSDVVFALTHNYTGYPLVRQAREMILSGELGEIQAIRAYYIQGWLRTKLEDSDQKQAAWRTDPTKSGAAGCFGDIATHAYNLGRYMTGLLPPEISANLRTFESGRKLDDYGTAVIKYQNGGLGTVTASQISHGRENDVSIEIDGTEGSVAVAAGGAQRDDCALQWRAAQNVHSRPQCTVHERRGAGSLSAAERSPGGLLRSLCQHLRRRLRRDRGQGERPSRSNA